MLGSVVINIETSAARISVQRLLFTEYFSECFTESFTEAPNKFRHGVFLVHDRENLFRVSSINRSVGALFKQWKPTWGG